MKTTRRGATMLEMIVAGALLGALLVICLQLCVATGTQRRAAVRRQCASLELANVMERVTARPWGQLTNTALAGEHLSPSASAQLPGAELKIEVFAAPGAPEAKRLAATVRWQDGDGRPWQPLTLTTWRYRHGDR
jgi:Tfp pilus assembly protein PilE